MTELIRLLVLDDDPMQLRLVERVLSREGFEVRAVATVAEMVVEEERSPPEFMMIDINLPDASTDEAVASARGAACDARIVLYSAWEETEVRAIVARVGADAFISKSASVSAIGPRLRQLRQR